MRYEDPKEIESILGTLTLQQLWAITKIAKHVRLRARNNVAFNNYMNKIFPYAKFTTVNKTRADGTIYPGLKIEAGGQSEEVEDAD